MSYFDKAKAVAFAGRLMSTYSNGVGAPSGVEHQVGVAWAP